MRLNIPDKTPFKMLMTARNTNKRGIKELRSVSSRLMFVLLFFFFFFFFFFLYLSSRGSLMLPATQLAVIHGEMAAVDNSHDRRIQNDVAR